MLSKTAVAIVAILIAAPVHAGGLLDALITGSQVQQGMQQREREDLEMERQKLRLERERAGLSSPYEGPPQREAKWDRATFVNQKTTNDYKLARCYYRTLYGHEFSMHFRGYTCPYHVEIEPESGRVRW